MPGLPEATVEFPFTGPLDEKSGNFSQDPSSAARMQNFVRVKTGELQVRDGWGVDSDMDVAEDATQLLAHRNRIYGVGPHFIQHEQVKLDHVPEFTVLKDVGITGGVNTNVDSSDITYFKDAQLDVGYWFQVASVRKLTDNLVQIVASQYEVNFDGASKLIHEVILATGLPFGTRVQCATNQFGVVVVWEDGTNLRSRLFTSLLGIINSGTPVTDYYRPGGSFFLMTNPDVTNDYFIAYTRDGGSTTQTFSAVGHTTFTPLAQHQHTMRGWGAAGGGGGNPTNPRNWDGGDGGPGAFAEVTFTGADLIEILIGDGGSHGNGQSDNGGGAAGGSLVAAWQREVNADISGLADGTTDLSSLSLVQGGNRNWQVDSGGTPTVNTGPAQGCDLFTGVQTATKYLYCETNGTDPSDNFILETLPYDTTGADPLIFFNLHAFFFGELDGTVRISAWNGQIFSIIRSQTGQSSTSDISVYKHWIAVAVGAQYRRTDFRWRIHFTRGAETDGDVYDLAIANLRWGHALLIAGGGGGGGGSGYGGDTTGTGGDGGVGGGGNGFASAFPTAHPGFGGGTVSGGGGGDGGQGEDGDDSAGCLGGEGGMGESGGGAAGGSGGNPGGAPGGEGGATNQTGGGGGGGGGLWGGGGGEGGDDDVAGGDGLGGAGGGGGSSYARDSGIMLTSAPGALDPPSTTSAGYIAGRGVAGRGGGNVIANGDGEDGGDGLIVYDGTSVGFVVRRVTGVATPVWTTLVSTNPAVPCCSLSVTATQAWVAWYRASQASYAILDITDGSIDLAETIVGAVSARYVAHISIKVRSDNFGIIAWSEAPDLSQSTLNTKRFRWAKQSAAGVQSYMHTVYRMMLVSQLFDHDGRCYCYAYIGDRGQDHDGSGSSTYGPVIGDGNALTLNEVAFAGTDDESGATVRGSPFSTFVLLDLRSGTLDELTTTGSVMPRLVGIISNDDAWYPEINVTSHVAIASTLDYRFAVSLPKWREENTEIGLVGDWRLSNTDVVWLRVNDPALWRAAEVGQAITLPSSLPSIWDGYGFHEIGFAHPPQIVLAQLVDGTDPPALYYMIAVYEYRDEYGNVYWSKPSTPLAINVTSNGVHFSVYVTPLCVTNRQDNENSFRDNVAIKLYRTLAVTPGGPYHLVAKVTNNPFTEFQVIDAVHRDDAASDNGIADSETLYTDGALGASPLPNEPPDPARYIASWRNRVWMAQDRTVWYSKERVEGEGLQFNAILRNFLEEDRGSIRGLVVQDGALLIGMIDRWYIVNGDGPDPAGDGAAFSLSQQLTLSVGLLEGEHLVPTGLGTFFRAQRGWYILGRDLKEIYISAPIEDTLAAFPVTKFAIKQRETDWVFIGVTNAAGTEGRLLRFDLHHAQWAVDTLPTIFLSGVQTIEQFRILDELANLREERPGEGDSSIQPVEATYETPWYSISGKLGWFRARRLFLLCRGRAFQHPGPNTVTVEMSTNYRDDWKSVGFRGVRADDQGRGLMMRFKPTPQPVTSIRFRITVRLATTAGLQDGSPPSLVSLMLRYAAPFPAARLGRNRSHKASDRGD